MKIFEKIKYTFFSLIIITLLAFAYIVTYTQFEPKIYDFMTKHVLTKKLPFDTKKNITGHDDIVLIVIDAKTNGKYRWPWKRERFCQIFEYFREYAQPKVVVFDSLMGALDIDNPESDRKFFNTLSKFDNLTVGFMPMEQHWENEINGQQYEKLFKEKYKIKNINYLLNETYDIYNSMLKFPEPYFKAIKNVGNVMSLPGFIDGNLDTYARDNVYRTYNYTTKYRGTVYPSLALSAFIIKNNYPNIVETNDYIEFPELNYRIPQKTNFYMNYTPLKFYKMSYGNYTYSHPNYSAVDIMDSYDNLKIGKDPLINPEIFKDKIVVIGANFVSGAGLNDKSNTPISTNQPGMDISATAIDNIVHNDFLTITPKWLNILITIIGMFFVYLLIRRNELIKSIVYTLFLILGYLALSTICFYYSIIFNIITPVVMFVLVTIIAYTHKYTLENRNKEKVKKAMSKYMSEDVMKKVIQNIDNLGLGGKKATVTVLFSDIRGFTSLSERMSAQQVSELLNEYFSEMEPIVTKYNGIINKFIGDAVMAVFGEPINDENHPINAVRCGYEMLLKVEALNRKWEENGKTAINIGIGINTGEVFVGNIGSEKRMEYTVIGDTVNLASRLESYNKTYHTKMLISKSTYEFAKKYLYVVKIPEVEIRGKSNKLDIYEVLKVKNNNN